MKNILTFCLAACALSASAVQAQIYKPTLTQEGNQWLITFHDDRASNHARWATQGLCFYYVGMNGTHEVYRWVSNTYPNWNGVAEKEGDQVFMYGDFWNERGHDGMEWEMVTQVRDSRSEMGAGHWHEWVENTKFGSFWYFGNAHFERKGYCSISRQSAKSTIQTNGESYDDDIGLQLSEQALEKYSNLEQPTDPEGNLLSPMGQVEK